MNEIDDNWVISREKWEFYQKCHEKINNGRVCGDKDYNCKVRIHEISCEVSKTTFIKLEYHKIFTSTRVLSFEKTDCEFVLLALSQISIQMLSQQNLQNQQQAANKHTALEERQTVS